MSSKGSMCNYVIFSDDLGTVTKYSPKNYVDFSIELEYSILNMLKLDNVPVLIDYTFDGANCESSIIMEKINGILLDDILDKPMAKQEAYDLFLNILCALGQIHSKGVTHGDIHGKNIILVSTMEELNKWVIGTEVYVFPSHGIVPYVIDFGLSYYPDTEFKADLGVTYSGCITSVTSNRLGDIISLLETMAYKNELSPLLNNVLSELINKKTIHKFIAIDEKITNYLKSHRFVKAHHRKFLSHELYNLVRCFQYKPLNKDLFDTNLNRFLKFVDIQTRGLPIKTAPRELFKTIKLAHFENTFKEQLASGSFVVNFLITKYTQSAYKLIEQLHINLPFTDTESAIKHFQDNIKLETELETELETTYYL